MNYKYNCQPVAFYSEEAINRLTWLLLLEDLWNLWIEFPWGDKYSMDWDFAIWTARDWVATKKNMVDSMRA